METVDDRITKTRVPAPADGTILSVPVIAGQIVVPAVSVNAGTTLATLADLSSLIVDAHVNQLDIGKVKLGDTVEVLGGADDSIRATAKINFIAPLATVKNNVKGFTVQAVLSGDTSAFRPGMTVAIRLPLATATNAVSVPLAAVFESRHSGHGPSRGSRIELLDQQGRAAAPSSPGGWAAAGAACLAGKRPLQLRTSPDKRGEL